MQASNEFKSQLPGHPSPFHDEHFLSWLTRFARANLCEAMPFTQIILSGLDVWGGCVNGNSYHKPEGVLSTLSGIEEKAIQKLYVVNFVRRHFIELNSFYASHYLLPSNSRSRKFRSNWMQYCPLCLLEDKEPYYRNKWRISFLPVCTKHKLILLNNCPSCSAPINFHRIPTLLNNISSCHNCLYSLEKSNFQTYEADSSLAYITELIESGISSGWVRVSASRTVIMPLFIAGLWILLKPFFRKKTALKMKSAFDVQRVDDNINISQFCHLNCGYRSELLSAIGELINNWPHNFLKICSRMKLNRIAFTINEPNCPFWIEDILRTQVQRFKPKVSDNEFSSACKFLRQRKYRVCYSNVAEVLGLNRSCHRTKNRDFIIALNYDKYYSHRIFHW